MRYQLTLENGSVYTGMGFGKEGCCVYGEVVFSTNMTGYTESLTDPSFCGQILCMTYPLIGNYGVPDMEDKDEHGIPRFVESDCMWVGGLVVGELCEAPSHHQSTTTLGEWLRVSGVPGIHGVDTRRLVQELRDCGCMRGRIEPVGSDRLVNFVDHTCTHPVRRVSRREPLTVGDGVVHIGVVDCGIKHNIVRSLLHEGFRVTLIPHDYPFGKSEFDGIFLSNGPGDPNLCTDTISNVRAYIASGTSRPLFGICLGNQILALAAGARTVKMKYGNRGFNQPVTMHRTGKTHITSQNHGYAVDVTSLPVGWRESCYNKNDRSNEGIEHITQPFRSVQFHPEARGGPTDTMYMFRDFYDECLRFKFGQARRHTVLLLGSGGLGIGQAGEFDYSGSQAIKSFKERGYAVVLVNPNIATVQTTDGFADEVYYVPVEPSFVEKIIQKERPECISLSFGGQTALNCGIALYESGVLHRHRVRVLGTSIDDIMKTEDRDLFSKAMDAIGEATPRSGSATTVEEARTVARDIGYPVLVRAAFALGGLGSGFCADDKELTALVRTTFTKTHQVLIDEDLRGWKEVEYEIMRDCDGNGIAVCNMENFDPLGVHTGDSIVVAPSQTLNNDEYNMLREASLRIACHLGIVGECNVQIALDPCSSVYKIIEVNPRLSRSSALASKATGYPIASVAARLCLGQRIAEITNTVTGTTTANFEPSLDYVVIKIPKWDTRKFPGVDRHLGSAMRSVGEVMAIGRTFEEAFQKGLRMATGFEFEPHGPVPTPAAVDAELRRPTDDRVRVLAHGVFGGMDAESLHAQSHIDRWFLHKLCNIRDAHLRLKDERCPLSTAALRHAKKVGMSDRVIGVCVGVEENVVRELRRTLDVVAVAKRIDTMAGEYPSSTNYFYKTYSGTIADACVHPREGTPKVLVIGSGTYRIGSSVEFDYCAVRCAQRLRERGYHTIMVNYNPETMSTDYDSSDQLYFEEISFESVMDICESEGVDSVVVSMGGQEPNNMAVRLGNAGVRIMGTPFDSIDTCEDRARFSSMLDELCIPQPAWTVVTDGDGLDAFVTRQGYPLLVRPSYVLSGAAMRVVHDRAEMDECLRDATDLSPYHPVVLTSFVEGAVEVDVDAVMCHGGVRCIAVSEHVEQAGVHSGDATMVIPAPTVDEGTKVRMLDAVRAIGTRLGVAGLFNTQFLVKDGWVGVIETNLRASRSVPFVSKTLVVDFVQHAVDAMTDASNAGTTEGDTWTSPRLRYVGVKCPQFSFARLPGADPVLGVEMASTGEVACFGTSLEEAYLKALVASKSGVRATKRRQSILQLDTDPNVGTLVETAGHALTRLDELSTTAQTAVDWAAYDMVVDVECKQETRALRRAAVDHSSYLVTNRQQLALIVRALRAGTTLAVEPYSFYKQMVRKREVCLFVRQGFTESGAGAQCKVQRVLDELAIHQTERKTFRLLTGTHAESRDTFQKTFERSSGQPFTPPSFRDHRTALLDQADAMVVLRTGMSESTSFEMAYHILSGTRTPMFCAIEPGCSFKTTLLRDLDGYKDVRVVYKVIEGGVENLMHDADFLKFLDSL